MYATEPRWRLPQDRPWPLEWANWRAWRRRRRTSLADSRTLRRRARALDKNLSNHLPARAPGFRHCLTLSLLSAVRRDDLWAGRYLVAWVHGYTADIGESPRLAAVFEAATKAKYAEGFANIGFGRLPGGQLQTEPEPVDPDEAARQEALRAGLDPKVLDEFDRLAGHIILAFDSDGRADARRPEWRSYI